MDLIIRRTCRLFLLAPVLHNTLHPISIVQAQNGAVGLHGMRGGGSASGGGFDFSDGPPHGFYLDGSTLPTLNGIYGPLSSVAGDIFEGSDTEEMEGMFYQNDHSGWVLARILQEGPEVWEEGGFEWVLIDPVGEERFVYEDNGTMRPRGGTDWKHVKGRVSRFVRKGDGAGDQDKDKETDIDKVDTDKDGDEAELPWLVGAIPNAIYFEQYLAKQRRHDAAQSAALQLRILPPLPPGSSDETTPSSESCQNEAVPPPGGGWPIAEAHLTRARRFRRARDFPSAERQLSSALTLYPRYLAAWEQYAFLALDTGEFVVAGERFGRIFAIDPDYPDLLRWLIRVASAVDREERQNVVPTGRCEVLHVGYNIGPEKELAVTSPIFRCPARVDRKNWLGTDGYDDSFSVDQDDGSEKVKVRREDEMGVVMNHGWGMDLRFSCCEVKQIVPEGEEEKPDREEERQSSVDHFQVLGVACDHTFEDLRAAYRAASFTLHPDKPGGSTEKFARVASAYKCLSEEGCRNSFERGDDLPVRQGGVAEGMAAEVERRFYPERFPYRPFGDPFARGRPYEERKRIAGAEYE